MTVCPSAVGCASNPSSARDFFFSREYWVTASLDTNRGTSWARRAGIHTSACSRGSMETRDRTHTSSQLQTKVHGSRAHQGTTYGFTQPGSLGQRMPHKAWLDLVASCYCRSVTHLPPPLPPLPPPPPTIPPIFSAVAVSASKLLVCHVLDKLVLQRQMAALYVCVRVFLSGGVNSS